jgi:hypothetical protein
MKLLSQRTSPGRLSALRPLLLGAALLVTCTPTKKEERRAIPPVGKLPPVELDGRYFVRGGKRFIPVGAHWVPAKAAMQWPVRWDPTDVEADFAKMHDLGYTLVRFDVLWAWLEPRPGEYNPEAFRQLDHLISLAHKYELYLHPSLFIGGEVGEAYWDVPWRNGRNPHTDPEMVRLETELAAELGKRYADESAIIAWDLTDEPPFWIVSGLTDAAAMAWTRAIASGIRRHDKRHAIVVGTSGQETSHGPFRSDVLMKDKDPSFFSVHPFTIYRPELFPDPILSERSTYGAAFEIALSSGAGRPAMVHEMGASTAQYSPERVALYERANLYSALAAGSIGVNLWCFTDAAPEQTKLLPYLRTPQETEWGMTTWDRKDKPRGRGFRSFSKVVAQLDLAGIAPADAESAIVIPEEWAKPHGDFSRQGLTGREPLPYMSVEDTMVDPNKNASANTWLMGSALSSFILSRRASLKSDFPREYDDWQKRPILLLPSPLTSTGTPFLSHVHSDFYERAIRYVEAGGFLYASVAADAAVLNMEALFGARLADTNTSNEITIKVVEGFGELKPGETFHFNVPVANARYWGSLLEVGRGRVIAVDQDNHPAIVSNTLGSGKTLLSAYPLESHLAITPSAFDRRSPLAHLLDALYRAVREGSRAKPLFATDDPSVEATTLKGADFGYAIFVNHGSERKRVTVKTTAPMRSLRQIKPEGAVDLKLDGSQWQMDIDPYEGVVVEFHGSAIR